MLSPAVRERSLAAPLRLSHWLGILTWLVTFILLQRLLERTSPGRDPYVFSLCALLCGWGILTIWRLDAAFGFRQTVWLVVSAGVSSGWQPLGDLSVPADANTCSWQEGCC
jgi:hypothetical protein